MRLTTISTVRHLRAGGAAMHTQSLRSSFALALLLSATVAHGTDAPPGASDAADAKARQELQRLETEWVTAEDRHDEAVLRRILDEKFVATFGSRTPPLTKEAFISALLAGDVDPTKSQTLSDQTVLIDGDTGVVVATDTERGTTRGAPYTAVARYTATYIRRQGRWVALAEHLVMVASAK